MRYWAEAAIRNTDDLVRKVGDVITTAKGEGLMANGLKPFALDRSIRSVQPTIPLFQHSIPLARHSRLL